MYDKLEVFDFDGTFFHTTDQHEGKRIWLEKTGLVWPYNGWWGKSETLNPDIFYSPVNQWVLSKYKAAMDDPKTCVILATGRLKKVANMRTYIEMILDENGITFDEMGDGNAGIYLNWGGDTFMFKTKLFEQLMSKLKVKDLIMYDDRHEHIVKFKEWAIGQRADVTIIDVTNKKTTVIENK
jgi:hypothetical protein